MLHHIVERFSDVHAGPLERLDLTLRRARISRDDRTRVAHPFARRRRAPRDERNNWLRIALARSARRPSLRRIPRSRQ